MPSKKPRVNVLLAQEDYDAVRQLSELNGESMSAIVAGLVSAVTPTIRRINSAIHAAQGMEAEMRARVGAGFDEFERQSMPQLEELQARYLDLLEGVAVLVPDGPERPSDPRPVTRGSVDPAPPASIAQKRANRAGG